MPVWEERWHPLREEWVIVAAHRQDRPWIGQEVRQGAAAVPPYVADCYLCPGNGRVSGARNPSYTGVYVFDNDHPSVGPLAPRVAAPAAGIYRNRPAAGIARVVCYSPRHDLTLAELELPEVDRLLEVWQDQYRDLGERDGIDHVLVFENKGEVVGVSNPHPHCQIYATNFVFKTIETEAGAGERHLASTGHVLFQDVLAAEQADGRRIIAENDSAIAFVPYFARYAYEVFVAPKATHPSLAALVARPSGAISPPCYRRFSSASTTCGRCRFPTSCRCTRPRLTVASIRGFHFHIEFHPPLRKPNLLKYLAGPEIGGGNFLSDTAPEEKAAELRDSARRPLQEGTVTVASDRLQR